MALFTMCGFVPTTRRGWGDYSPWVSFTTVNADTVPGVPGQPTMSAIGGTTATAAWAAPASDGGATITQYGVEVSASTGFSPLVVSTTTAGALSKALSGLAVGGDYYCRIRAYNYKGWGDYSTYRAFSMLDVPTVPTSFSITRNSNSLTAIFSAPADNGGSAVTGYSIQIALDAGFTSGVQSKTSGGSPVSFTGLTPDTVYYVRVAAINQYGTGPWVTGSTTLLAPLLPTVPQGLTLSGTSDSLTATFTAPSSMGDGAFVDYTAELATDAGFTLGVQTVSSSGSPISFSALTPGGTYYVRVRANSTYGAGAWSTASITLLFAGLYLKVLGVWKPTNNVYIKIAGAWRNVFRVWVKVAGTWR